MNNITLRQLEATLQAPALFIEHKGLASPIQRSQKSLSHIPGFGDTHWQYLFTTPDKIPVFKYVDERPVTDFVNITSEGNAWKAELK